MNDIKFILIAATGRSGSTTLQRIVNIIPNSNITGENDNAIIHLLECYNSLKNAMKFKQIAPSIENCIQKYGKPCWYNSFNIEKIKQDIKNVIINILMNNANNRVLGFKEIRYYNCIHLLDTFIELFPNTKVICHYRKDTDKQLKSGWFTDKYRDHITDYNNQIISYYEKHKNYCYLSNMEDMLIADNVKKMFMFLNEPFDKDKYELIIKNKLE